MEFKFVGIMDLTEDLFKTNPIWILYEDPEQDEEISKWGVDIEIAWKNKSENPENEYYFPYLGAQEPSLSRGIEVYCTVKTKDGKILSGVLTGGFAFSVYFSGKQYLFNRNMSDHGAKTSKELCLSIDTEEVNVFPLTYIPLAQCYSGKILIHDTYW